MKFINPLLGKSRVANQQLGKNHHAVQQHRTNRRPFITFLAIQKFLSCSIQQSNGCNL